MAKRSELQRVIDRLDQQIAQLQATKQAILDARDSAPPVRRVRVRKPKPAKDEAAA